jgi:hypothetical protein
MDDLVFREILEFLSVVSFRKYDSRHVSHLRMKSFTCDNGPQFDCSEFRKFASLWEFKHETSSSLYPQSNGKVEQAVKTAKQLMRKATVVNP